MKNLSRFINFFLFIACLTLTTNVFADVKIKSRQTMQGQTSENTIYIKGKRQRTEMANGVMTTILQCDLRRDIQIMPQAQTYLINNFDNVGDGAQSEVPNAKTETSKGGIVTTIVTNKDTGERKQMFGYTARHIITTMETSSSPDSCSQTKTKRGLLGFYIFSDDALVLAWTEILPTGSANANNEINDSNHKTRPAATETNSPASAIVLNVDKNVGYVNVMGNQMPAMPQFPSLSPKPGRVRGYVKDWTGKPLAGATIGIRASYFAGYYSGAQGTTDAKGYYEFVVPKGSAHFYNAGYAIEWGDGLAALGLHPADGKLDSFTTADGAVENFVFLPYGMTSHEKVQDNPFVPSSYYGGSIYINYDAFEASDNRPYAGSIPENSIIEITLASEAGQSFFIRKTAGFQSLFRINNIPLGRYQISAKVNGKSLNLKQTGVCDEMFGMKPRETNGAASVLLAPDGAKAEMVAPQSGGWKPVSIKVQR